jgi:hypothetical protein
MSTEIEADQQEPGDQIQTGLRHAASEVSSALEKALELSTDSDYSLATQAIDKFLAASHEFIAQRFAPILEKRIGEKILQMELESEKVEGVRDLLWAQRDQVSKWANNELRQRGLTFACKDKACRIAVGTYTRRPELGRFQMIPIGAVTAVRQPAGNNLPTVGPICY